jgi:hypothetical protein
MREINIDSDNPISLTIAADARLSTTNYVDDQIWELKLKNGEPPALALETTYGLRAPKVRLFPRFVESQNSISDPRQFSRPPIIRCYYPNFFKITYDPIDEINITSENWVPGSNAIAGRIRITNSSSRNRQIRFEWVAMLTPGKGDHRMAPNLIEDVPILVGSSGDLIPVAFITGGASTVDSPYPALVFGLDLPPDKSRQFIWCQAALSTEDESFRLAREIAAFNWEAEIARIELQNAGQVEIHSGNSDWDTAFALTQNKALGLLMSPTSYLPEISLVAVRNPDNGHSFRLDGSDYGPLWNGQTPLDSYYLSDLILPSAPKVCEGLLSNFLERRNEGGEFDWKPGLGGQLTNQLATPMLASLAWRIYQVNEDKDFLRKVFPPLLEFVLSWFSSQHDRDADGISEWDHPIQAGFEDHPIFSRWQPWAQGIDITTAESPSLCAFLYQECQILIRIAKVLNHDDHIPNLVNHAENLHAAVEAAWDEQDSTYLYWDRDTHISSNQEIIGDITGSGSIYVNEKFNQPYRLVIRIRVAQETTRKPQIIIHGVSHSGKHKVERIGSDRILWFPGWGTATSEKTYTEIEYIEVSGLDSEDYLSISSAGLSRHDLTTLLPLWAGIPSNQRAHDMVKNVITNPQMYWRSYGMPACPDYENYPEIISCRAVYLPWCTLIGEGLISYGYREESAELVTRIMEATIQTLKEEGDFRQYYQAETGKGFGETNALWGLAPLGLFLTVLGVRLISHHKVGLAGINPFPWPVTVKYRGLTILRSAEKTQVVFPDGQIITVEDPEPRIVSLE